MATQDTTEPRWAKRSELKLLNTDIRRVDGPEKVQGMAKYTHDIRLPGMVYAKLLLSKRPAATVALDVNPALDIDGVADVVPLLPDGQSVAFLGQPLAAVAAVSPEVLEDAVRAIDVRYEEGGWVVSYEQAIQADAPATGRSGNIVRPAEEGDLGAAREALDACDVQIEATYTLPVQHHCCLETHGAVVDYRGGNEATVYISTQVTHMPTGEMADILGIPAPNVRVVVNHMGGGFGSKFGLGAEGAAACLLAKRLGRPVHLMLSRSDEFLMAGNRSGSHQELIGGATADGRFKALIARASKLGGIGNGSFPGSRPYIYDVESFHVLTQSVRTHTDAGRAMRAPGHPQASFGIESMIDELAYGIQMDPVEFRKMNLTDPVYHRQLDRVAKEIGWLEHPHRTRPGKPTGDIAVGIGFGISTWTGGGGPICQVEVRIEPDGAVTVSVGSQDLGTGTRTYVAAIVAEELGLPIEAVTPRIGDNAYGQANGSGGSTTTASLAPAVKDAAHNARVAFFARVADEVGVADPTRLRAVGGEIVDLDDAAQSMSWSSACAALGSTPLVANGSWKPGLSDQGIHGAQAARVEVNTKTGAYQVTKMVALHDCGLPLNRLALRSQINGGMIQALSFGMFEERVIDPWLGTMLSADFDNYKIAGTMEIPELVALIDDEDEREGVIGVAEANIIPGHSAIACAIFNACGVRLRSLPLSPMNVLEGLLAQKA